MSTINPFSATGYDVITLTRAINNIPDAARYIGIMATLGIFKPEPITTTTLAVEEYNGSLNLLVSQPRGGPAAKNAAGKRKMRNFTVPHYPLEDVIKPEEVQNVRAFGTENTVETIDSVYAKKLGEMRRKHDLTREWLRFQAIKGSLIDSDNTTLYNYYTEFGISQTTIDLDLDVSTSDINGLCRDILFSIEDNLKGDMMTGAVAFCARDFYKDFINHANVKAAFQYFTTTQQLSGDFRKQFEFGGIIWIPIGATTTDPAGTSRKFIEDAYSYVIPLGTQDTFSEILAPADFMETVNTPGLPFYAKTEMMKFGRGMEVHTQMNVMPICKKPGCIVKVGKNID